VRADAPPQLRRLVDGPGLVEEADVGGVLVPGTERGKKRVKTWVRAECRPVSTPSWNGELADTARSSGSQFRSALVTRIARSAPRIATCVWIPNVLLRQTTYWRSSLFRR
jgi:hypothetical protein